MKKILVAVLVALLSPAITSAAETFYLDQNNIGLTGGPWAAVILSDTTDGFRDGVHFYVDPDEDMFPDVASSPHFGLQTFYFNEGTGFGGELSVENFNPSSWSYTYSSDPSYNAGGGFGMFMFQSSGSGSNRGNPLQFDVFAPAGETLSIADLSTILSTEGYIFAAHIAGFYLNGNEGFNGNDSESAKFAYVPIPSAAYLFGAGLVGLVILKRRRLKT